MDPKAAALLGAGLAMGLGAIGPGIGIGNLVGKVCKRKTKVSRKIISSET